MLQMLVSVLTGAEEVARVGEDAGLSESMTPEAFDDYKREALSIGFSWVESGPFVRSSFHAKDSFDALKTVLKKRQLGAKI